MIVTWTPVILSLYVHVLYISYRESKNCPRYTDY
jgi:hypothetical protein